MRKKYFFFDIDGTLTDNKTLDQLKANGHFVSIATGRAHYKAVSFTDKINIIILSAMVADVLLLMIR